MTVQARLLALQASLDLGDTVNNLRYQYQYWQKDLLDCSKVEGTCLDWKYRILELLNGAGTDRLFQLES
jgi:hypothetical protein